MSDGMLVGDFDFALPPDLIAQEPVERGGSRLLHLDRRDGAVSHQHIADLPALLRPGDLLVVNDTRVFPARLLGRRLPGGGAVECLLVERLDTGAGQVEGGAEHWEALMHPGQRLRPGSQVVFEPSTGQGGPGGDAIRGEVLARRFQGRRKIRLWTESGIPLREAVDRIGHTPLPPYIRRADRAADRARYQTVFARVRGSIAAPTAGLHFDETLLGTLRARGVQVVAVTLHVGYGTFQPVRVERVEDHQVEPERYEISGPAAREVNRALDEKRRVIAVGTTTTRTLEAVARLNGGRLAAGSGTTGLFITPGFEFKVIDGLVTNFHLPRSSLLMLVAALAGRERVLAAYSEAVALGYRFYSYGDAMLIL